MSCRAAGVLACFGLFFLATCSRPATPPQRFAILRFENLGADNSQDWMGRAFSEVLTHELEVQGVFVVSPIRLNSALQALGPRPNGTPGISSQRAAAIASGANRLGYGEYSAGSGRVEARLTIENAASGKIERVLSASADGVIPAASRLAADLSGKSAEYLTRNAVAIEGYASALESNDAAIAMSRLEQAMAADPDFTPAYRLLAEWKARQQDRAGALGLLERALARGNAVRAEERAMIEAEIAGLRGDSALRERALADLTKLRPRDPAVWRSLADAAMARHNYRQAADAFARIVEVEPEDPAVWNQYGYAAAYAGDLPNAMTALRRYQTLRPTDANPLDSQGDVNLLHGRLREAEGFYLEAARKNPNFLNGADGFKAAMARLMTGDAAGADALAKQYVKSRTEARDPLAAYRAAEWAWAAGRRKAAYGQMEEVARTSTAAGAKEVAARAWLTVAIWSLMFGDRESAARSATQALSLASGPPAVAAFIARFLAQPPASPAEWTTRAELAFRNAPATSLRELTLAYALLFEKQFAAAQPFLKDLEARSTIASDMNMPILLAWSMVETGKVRDAEPLLRWNPIPPPNGTGPFVSLYFPRLFYLRAIVAEQAGKADEARTNYRLFTQLSGPDGLLWGEEKRASGR